MTVQCHQCNSSFEDYGELARHINDTKSHHINKKAYKWACNYLYKHVLFKPEQKLRMPLTEEQKETKKSLNIELSGKVKSGIVICPKCKQIHHEVLPSEYLESSHIWRINGQVAILCNNCKS